MAPLEQESNLEVVRTYALLLREEVKRLAAENARLKDLKANDQQQSLHENLRDQLVRLQKKFYGFGREEIEPKKARSVGHKQQKLKLHNRRPHQENTEVQSKSVQVKEVEKKSESIIERIQYDFSQEQLKIESDIREVQVSKPEEAWTKISGLRGSHVNPEFE